MFFILLASKQILDKLPINLKIKIISFFQSTIKNKESSSVSTVQNIHLLL